MLTRTLTRIITLSGQARAIFAATIIFIANLLILINGPEVLHVAVLSWLL
jgi:hypothetical protein